ncbi:hypothetical protein BGC_49300 [Burkholderia sp. 3C]
MRVRQARPGVAAGTDRRKLGSKHHLIVNAQGIPLAVVLSGVGDLRNASKVTCPMFQRPAIR